MPRPWGPCTTSMATPITSASGPGRVRTLSSSAVRPVPQCLKFRLPKVFPRCRQWRPCGQRTPNQCRRRIRYLAQVLLLNETALSFLSGHHNANSFPYSRSKRKLPTGSSSRPTVRARVHGRRRRHWKGMVGSDRLAHFIHADETLKSEGCRGLSCPGFPEARSTGENRGNCATPFIRHGNTCRKNALSPLPRRANPVSRDIRATGSPCRFSPFRKMMPRSRKIRPTGSVHDGIVENSMTVN